MSRRPWKDARTVADLGNAMADWLEGRIAPCPSFCDGGPDDETRHLIPTLVACNRAGYVTTCSQPGHLPTRGCDGRTYRQRAFVKGWISDTHLLNRIRAHAKRSGITVIAIRPGGSSHPTVPVTEADGEVCAAVGFTPGHRRLIASDWRGVGSNAVRELRTATQIALVDPEWGRDTLWSALARAVYH
ncbi:hypothetical protein GCM10010341_73060 [Streptomyces noursei]|nr:hypothetical protein GCM10010341_73060 [Streptomyces noursei]